MHVNRRLGRFKQWAGERMGGDVKTNESDDFKTMEEDMNMRHDGMERLQKSMTAYIKALSKRNEGDDKEKPLAVGHMGATMVNHGENFDCNSEYGRCLVEFGRTNERIARIQEQYVSSATTSWLESLERSVTQMKEYQASRKKLETRRLAYDTSLAKVQKAKREDFRVEEELRSHKVKYEEASDDVYRRMEEIKESESDSVADLAAFLDAELSYHDKCREVLLQLKDNWPTGNGHGSGGFDRRPGRARQNTGNSHHERYERVQTEPVGSSPEHPVRLSARAISAHREDSPPKRAHADPSPRPPARAPTVDGQVQRGRQESPPAKPGMTRVASDSASSLRDARSQLRVVSKGLEPCNDSADDLPPYGKRSPERHLSSRNGSVSPAASNASGSSRTASAMTKKAPPPPPPSRSTKPPPPPPPVRRTPTAVDM